MAKLPVTARVYIVAMVSVAALLLLRLQAPTVEQLPTFVGLALASIGTSTLKLRLPTTKNRSTMSVSYAADFAALLLLGADQAMAVAAAGAAIQSTINARTCKLHQTLFNVSSLIVTIQAAGLVYHVFGGAPGRFVWPASAIPVAAAALTYFVANTEAVALAVALSTKQPLLRVWQHNYLWSAPAYFVGAGVAVAMAELITRGVWGVLPLAALQVYFIYRAYQVYAARLAEEHRHREVIETLNEGMVVVQRDGRLTLWNDAIERMTGVRREQVLGRSLGDAVPALASTALAGTIDAVSQSGNSQTIESFELATERGRRILQIRLFPFVAGVTIFFNDITERAEAEAALIQSQDRLRHAALHDPLTNVPNRSFFMELLAQALARSNRHQEYGCALLFLDIDRFKVVNDNLGHQGGDDLLVAISRRLESCLREGDVMGRLGGDEFTMLLNGVADASHASRVADRVLAAFASPFVIDGVEVCTSASIGIALSAAGYTRPEHMMRDADTAMYRAKAMGKSRYNFFDDSMRAYVEHRTTLESDLRQAIDRGELALHYQPIVSLPWRELIGFEALLRWQRAGRLVPPAEFITVADETGIIELLGAWVLREACRQTAAWRRRFPAYAAIGITVNVSTRQLTPPDFLESVRAATTGAGLSPGDLRLEIKETTLIDKADRAAVVLRALRELGAQICLDDFGTGFSSLSYLHRFPIDALKIDRSFVATLADRDRPPAIVESILALAKALGTHVIAEGIESHAQMTELVRLGCGEGQGYLFSKPLPADSVEALLARCEWPPLGTARGLDAAVSIPSI